MNSKRIARPIRVQLVDNHDMVRAGLCRLLGDYPDIRVVAESNCGKCAITDYLRNRPDIMILDIAMPDISGFEVIHRILPRAPEARILVLSFHEHEMIPERVLRMGALGYLTKGSNPSLLIKAIRRIHAGGTFVEPVLAQKLAVYHGKTKGRNMTVLTPREFDIFLMLAVGQSTLGIARNLSISPKTVGNHHHNIMQKLHISNKAELARFAIQLGLISA